MDRAAPCEPITPKGRRTRDALLDAGEIAARTLGAGGLSVATVTAQAGVAKGTFYVHFEGRDAFLRAMHRRFLARASDALDHSLAGLEPGAGLLQTAIEVYLDLCLEHPGAAAVTERFDDGRPIALDDEQLLASRIQPSLKAIGIRPSRVAGRLVASMAHQTARIELEAGGPVRGARKAIAALTAPR